jgi:hypothetical protein
MAAGGDRGHLGGKRRERSPADDAASTRLRLADVSVVVFMLVATLVLEDAS